MRLLFLGYDRAQTGLIDFLEGLGHEVAHTADPATDLSAYDLAISYGYRHILRRPVLDTARRPVFNLHIAYLPWNKGAHPLFWARFEGTPLGVTIHEIDEGVDTGPICFQRRVELAPDETTFALGYARLTREMEALFRDNAGALITGTYTAKQQRGKGTAHRVRDLPSGFAWSDEIAPTIERLRPSANDKPPVGRRQRADGAV